jgi:uncharacterized membrane protein YbhN (UPF0104 family)
LNFPYRRWLIVAILAFSAYAAALFVLEHGQIGSALSLLASWSGLMAATLCLVSYLLRGLRWIGWMRLQERPLALGQGLRFYLAGYAFTPTPGNLGEAARGLLLTQQPLALGKCLAVFGAERLADLLCLLLLALPAAWWLLPGLAAGWRAGLLAALVSLLVLAVLGLSLAGASLRLRPMVESRLPWLRAAWLCLAHRPALWFVQTFAAWSMQGVALWLLCQLALVPLGPIQASASYALAMVGGALSMLPAGLGGTEALLLVQLSAQGASLESAVLLTVVARLLTLWFAVALGVVCLLFSVAVRKDMRLASAT